METAPIPANDSERLISLRDMRLLSTPREMDLDRITRMAKLLMGADIALISLVDEERQWFKSCYGLEATETPRGISFCGHAIHHDELFVVPNALDDTRFSDNPLVTGDPKIRFYAGEPLTNDEGFRIGTLCVVSTRPRTVTPEERVAMSDLARMAELVLSKRKLGAAQQGFIDSMDLGERESLIDVETRVWTLKGLEGLIPLEMNESASRSEELVLMLVSIDSFDRVIRTDGPSGAHKVVQGVCEFLLERGHSCDVVGRINDDTFFVLTRNQGAGRLTDFVDGYVRSFRPVGKSLQNGIMPLTISVAGCAFRPASGSTERVEIVMSLLTDSLALAQGKGGNQFHIADIPEGI